MKYKIKNFYKYQHFHDRKPPWIKLYRDLLDEISWFRISGEAARTLINFWLLASESHGNLPPEREIMFRLRLEKKQYDMVVKELIEFNFLEEGEYPLAGTDDMNMNERIRKTNGFSSRYIKNETKTKVLIRDNHKCQSCDSTKNLEFDHIIPVSKGGSSEADNLQLLCRSCNRSKRAKSHDEFTTYKTEKDCALRSLETEIEEDKERNKYIYSNEFEKFWEAFPPTPRKSGKKYCFQVWTRKKLNDRLTDILNNLEYMKNSDQWKKDCGQWIPMPSTYLNQERFDMEIPKVRNAWEGGI